MKEFGIVEEILTEKEESFLGPGKSSAISLGLDDYDDIFSDFDSSPYSERMFSEDFLFELKRESVDREESGLTLTLQLPGEKRNAAHEKIIHERLRAYFRRYRRRFEEKRKSQLKNGGLMVLSGVLFIFLATYLLNQFPKDLWASFTVVLLEPAGWFTLWEGSELILFRSKESTPDLAFYRKMSSAKIVFASHLPITPVEPKP